MLVNRLCSNLSQSFFSAAAVGCFVGLAGGSPAKSAENIYLDYDLFGRVIPTASLESFAVDGTLDESLMPYLGNLPPSSQQQLQTILSTPVPSLESSTFAQISDPFVLSQWLHSPIGELFLETLGALVQTAGRQNGGQALRAALTLAAADPEGLSLINIIRFYPTDGIRLDLPKILALYQGVVTNVESTDRLIAIATQQSQSVAASDVDSESAFNYAALPVLADADASAVEVRSLTLEDKERSRTYPADLYLPNNFDAIEGSIPVMIFSHGYGETRTESDTVTLARSLAANGFVVAVPEHIGSNKTYRDDLAEGLNHESFEAMEFINRPLDIQFLLDTLEHKNDTEFQGRLQLENVGLMGYSFGGYTALSAAGATVDLARLHQQCDLDSDFTPDTTNVALLIQCRLLELESSPGNIQLLTDGSLQDDRVGLVIAFAPLTNLFGEGGMNNIQSPVVIMGGTYDIAAPIVLEQAMAFQWLKNPQKYFYLAENISHTTELTRIILDLVSPQGNSPDEIETAERWVFNLAVTLAIAHGKVYLSSDESYRPYLTSAYVEAVSIEPTTLHLLRAFPDNF